jgi:hypothetical protein
VTLGSDTPESDGSTETQHNVLRTRSAKVGMLATTAQQVLATWATFQFADLVISEFVNPKDDDSVVQVVIEDNDVLRGSPAGGNALCTESM